MHSRFEPEETSQEARRMLDSYLQRACRSDDALISEPEQDELRQEMSGHILALAAAHEELGAGPEEAMQAALKQFGEAEQIGKAVAREIGKRPSWLGSPLTVSMLGGVLVNWLTLSGANYLIANTGLDLISPEGRMFGIVLGCITGGVIWRRRKSVRQAALWNGRFCAGATAFSLAAFFVYCCTLGGSASKLLTWDCLKLAGPALLQWVAVAELAGVGSGILTGIWCRFVRQALTDRGTTAIGDDHGTSPA